MRVQPINKCKTKYPYSFLNMRNYVMRSFFWNKRTKNSAVDYTKKLENVYNRNEYIISKNR